LLQHLNRRGVVASLCVLGSGVFASLRSVFATEAGRRTAILGAIRWDAWYDPTGPVGRAVENDLAAPAFQSRMPFFGRRSAAGGIVVDGDHQDIMDQEIQFAAFAKIDYWAYCWYPQQSSMENAWRLHQSSAIRDRVNWCMIWQFSNLGGPDGFARTFDAYVGWFAQSNYQTVLGGRPVVYLFLDEIEVLHADWGGSWSTFERSLGALRQRCAAAKVPSPYLIVMGGPPSKMAVLLPAMGGDAISDYISPIPHEKSGAFADLDRATRDYWEAMAKTGAPMVPIAMTGWDQRPRKLDPPFFWHATPGDEDPAFYIEHGTPDAIGQQIEAAVDFVRDHPSSCPSHLVIVYSWNECDEGGSALVPTRSGDRIDTDLIDALHRLR
jgi:hypothetical protein